MISPELQRPSATWLWPVTERDHMPLSWARTPAVLVGRPTCGMTSSMATEQGLLFAVARGPASPTGARFCRTEPHVLIG
jgi:hypothetical protein